MMGGKRAHEFMYLTPVGEDTIVLCNACGYAANRQLARFTKPSPNAEEPGEIEKVETPGAKTIQGLCEQLNVPAARTAKVLFMTAELPGDDGEDVERLVLAMVRGDMEVNETKLTNAVRAKDLRPATEAEIRASGAEPGFGSPMDLNGVQVVVDDALAETPNVVTGANEAEYHLMNVNVGRDFEPDLVIDIAAAQAGDACPECQTPLATSRGIEVGNIFQLGTRYSEATDCNFVDESGHSHPIIMGSYGIGLERTLASIAEEHRDDDGLIWPISVAPYDVHLVTLPKDSPEVVETGDRVYEALRSAGLDVLYDDREESPGVKFTDADLIGVPLRITIGQRALDAGGVELKRRDADAAAIVAEADVPERVQAVLDELWQAVTV
jgi:prolyl-tRNA synthetase